MCLTFVNTNAQHMIYHNLKSPLKNNHSKKFCLEYVYMIILKKFTERNL